MKEKASHPILVTIIIVLSVTVCALLFTAIFQNFRAPITNEPTEIPLTIPGDTKPYHFDYSWLKHPYVAHAMGGIDGYNYTNSYEAFLLNYDLGHRVFEVDFVYTDDGKIVLAHDSDHWLTNATVQTSNDWTTPSYDTSAFTYDNFMSSLWYDKYHPLDFEDLLHLMQSHPDIYIITDSKYTDKTNIQSEFDEMVKLAKNIDESLLNRFVIQIYNPEMLDWAMAVHPWKSVLYTLYAVYDTWTPENVLTFAEASGVKVITMVGAWINQTVIDTWKPANLTIIPHTVNNLNDVKRYQTFGIDHFYTDYLLPRPIL